MISENRKVRILMTGIQDNRLATAKSQVTGTPELKATFDGAVNFISQFLDERRLLQNQAMNPPRNVLVANVQPGRNGDNGQGRGGGGRRTFGRGGFGRNNGRGGYGGRNNGRGGAGGAGRHNNVTDKYYTQQDWAALTQEQQE